MCDAAGERCARQSGKTFMGALLGVAEKACKIARILRLNVDFGSKLINQKADREKGDVIEQDYVSFADVFIQCVVKHDLELLVSFLTINSILNPHYATMLGLTKHCYGL